MPRDTFVLIKKVIIPAVVGDLPPPIVDANPSCPLFAPSWLFPYVLSSPRIKSPRTYSRTNRQTNRQTDKQTDKPGFACFTCKPNLSCSTPKPLQILNLEKQGNKA